MSEQVPDVSPTRGRSDAAAAYHRPSAIGTNRARPRLLWYAETSSRRSVQLTSDVLVVAWCLVWVLVGVAVHGAVSALAAPALALSGGTDRTADELREAADGVAGIPLVGDDVSAPFESAADAVGRLTQGAAGLAEQVQDLAVLVGVLVPLTPVSLVLLLWLPARLRSARRAGAARSLLDAGADPQLFALRALATQPLHRLGAVSADPVGDWRRGDAVVTARLAGLELDRLGVRSPGG